MVNEIRLTEEDYRLNYAFIARNGFNAAVYAPVKSFNADAKELTRNRHKSTFCIPSAYRLREITGRTNSSNYC